MKNGKMHWHEAVSSARNFPLEGSVAESIRFEVVNLKIEKVSQTCFDLDVVKVNNSGSPAE